MSGVRIDMTGRVCVITGGAGHLGRVMARAYRNAGAEVVVLDRAYSAEQIADLPTDADRIVCDLADPEDRARAVQTLLERRPVIDVLIHNAAFVGTDADAGWNAPFESQDPDLFRRAVEINLTAPFAITQALVGALRASGRGSIVMVGSIYGLVGPDWDLYAGLPMANPAGYAASKGGLVQLTRWLATTLAPDIRVNAFCPGGVARGQPDVFQDRYVRRTPLGRMARPEDFEGPALFLGSDLSAYITGQVLAVDGGWTAW